VTKYIGILTSGGDNPGLNAAIRGVGKAAIGYHGMQVIGFLDGFRGFLENRTMELDDNTLSGILTLGGTILGTSRDKPHRMPVGGKLLDMTDVMVDNYRQHNLDVLVCIGGGGTQKNAYRLAKKGLNIITLPKTIDNDVVLTDVTFGFDTALSVATEAIDRLHSTAHSHHRIIVVEIMGHNVGWLALGAGISGGADVILIPEIPYDVECIADTIRRRSHSGKRFSLVAVAEGAASKHDAEALQAAQQKVAKAKSKLARVKLEANVERLEAQHAGNTLRLATQLEGLTGLESRVTILGHLQRGGTPSAADRLLASRLGIACAELIHKGKFGVMVAARGDGAVPVPLQDVAGKLKSVPFDHSWVATARRVGTCMGD
jgi:ATP-dependent phosphofructokinase / diphosphate-dependent phosphofructokinase